MIFFGDMAVGTKVKVQIPDIMKDKTHIVNLEGALVSDVNAHIKYRRVVNNLDYISEYVDTYGKVVFSLCNNHILDNNDINETMTNLDSIGVDYFGAGNNIESASKPLVIGDVIVLTFGWSVIECDLAGDNIPGVNPLKRDYILSEFSKYSFKYPGRKIIILFHWDYELEKYPMPSQRKLAHELIDLGCECIVGAHSHRVQGVEIYKGKAIVYSLGNWAFEQGFFISGRLKFPDFCNLQLAFEYSEDGNHLLHYFNYNRIAQTVNYLESNSIPFSKINEEHTPFNGMPFKDYDKWFINNRYHKKMIPIYFSEDGMLLLKAKDIINKLRTNFIKCLVNFKVKL
ncbi:CapA family protein [Photobacterium leiognathi]|uniref:CapA family protein n=1 Tax=Photobacterium leiognathi TaxID=553611 RepID=UPI002980B633|nr:CapA family protein [Photobacterium leiognathi]